MNLRTLADQLERFEVEHHHDNGRGNHSDLDYVGAYMLVYHSLDMPDHVLWSLVDSARNGNHFYDLAHIWGERLPDPFGDEEA